MTLPFLDAESLAAALPMREAVDALERVLLAGLDPSADPARVAVSTSAGQLLVMPSAAAGHVGVKLVSVAPENPSYGRPRIQGVFVLFDPVTLAPAVLLDGQALTSLRTPAVSALAARHVARPDARRLLVFGTGPQGEGHVSALQAVRPIEEVVVVGRDRARAEALVGRCADRGLRARLGSADDVAGADVIVCATTARQPLFDGRLVRDDACVIAVGSHEPTAREVDARLVGRSNVVVEDVDAALREAGDLIMAGVRPADVRTLRSVVTERVPVGERPILVKTVGMAWEDAVVASAAVSLWTSEGAARR